MANQEESCWGGMKGYVVLKKVDLLELKSAVIAILLVLDEAALMPRVEKGIGHGRREGADLRGFLVPSTHPIPRS